jgi:hypothetical protein
VRDLSNIGEVLADFYEEQGRNEEAEEIKRRTGPPSASVRCSAEGHAGHNTSPEKAGALGDESPPLSKPARTAPLSSVRSPVRSGKKIGRNSPCPCGSGLKFKKCCGGAKQPA